MKKKIGIYGGTFDPPHNAHVRFAKAFIRQVQPDKLIIVPDLIPPHKALRNGSASPEDRYEMCVRAFGSFAQVSDWEIGRSGVSYTIDTVKHFASLYPDSRLYLLIGDDMLTTFTQWRCFDEILSAVTIAAAPRSEEGKQRIAPVCNMLRREYGADIVVIDLEILELSSTEIRCALCTSALPDSVAEYIREKKLYGRL